MSPSHQWFSSDVCPYCFDNLLCATTSFRNNFCSPCAFECESVLRIYLYRHSIRVRCLLLPCDSPCKRLHLLAGWAPRSEFQWSVRIKMRKSSNLITRRFMQFLLHMWRVSVFSVPLNDITEGKMLLMASAAAAWLPLNHPPAITTALTACTLLAFRGRRWKRIKLFCERKKCPNWICSHHHFDYSQAFAFPCSYLEWGGGEGGTE